MQRVLGKVVRKCVTQGWKRLSKTSSITKCNLDFHSVLYVYNTELSLKFISARAGSTVRCSSLMKHGCFSMIALQGTDCSETDTGMNRTDNYGM